MLTTKQFLQKVITADQPGYFYMAVTNGGAWLEQWHRWPDDIDQIVSRAEAQAETANVYFSSYLFKSTQALKANVLPSRTLQADLDEADLTTLPRDPNVLVETSPGRHQGFWVLDKAVSLDEHEELSRRLTYSIPLCDKSGWPLGRKVRIPNTLNHKYNTGPKSVKVVKVSEKLHRTEELEALPEVPGFILEHFDEAFAEAPAETDEHPREILERIREMLPATVYVTYDIAQADRSATLYALMCYAFKAGLNRSEVFTLAKGSANNKFDELKYRGETALAKDVLRAELAVKSRSTDHKQVIHELFKSALHSLDRRKQILTVVIDAMRANGTFIHANNGYCWYIRNDIGRPVQLTAHSEALYIMLDVQFGLNYTEPEAKYCAHGLRSYANNLPPTGTQTALAYYDPDESHLLLHTGRRGVLRITASAVEKATNGAYDVVFPWHQSVEEFTPTEPGGINWGEEIFGNGTRGNGTSVKNLTNLKPNEAMALLKVWFMFVLLRNAASSRPIIATFGQPGCLSGEMLIEFKRGTSRIYSARLKQFYKVFESESDKTDIRIMSFKSGEIKWRSVSGVVYSGVKQTFKLQVEGRDPVYATADHRFLTPDGYKELKELKVGDSVITKGDDTNAYGTLGYTYRRHVRARHHPHAWVHVSKPRNGYGPYTWYKIAYARAVIEAAMNSISTERFLHIVHYDPMGASHLKYLAKDIHIHHKDEDSSNDDLSNLEVKDANAHLKTHASERVFRGAYKATFEAIEGTVLSIESHREEPTYDIQMADEEAPNFLVSDVVSHNSGKSTLFRKVFVILYGKRKSLGAVTNMDDFDHNVATDPLVILDNVDTWEKWLPDRIALSAGTSDLIRRKLYTDSETVTLKRQAMVGVTAHNPQFGREDVADRFLLFAFRRFDHFVSEEPIYHDLYERRNQIWGAIIHDLQKVLQTPRPVAGEAPQFRIEDFARIGLWISRALGCEADFRASIKDVKSAQQSFNLEEEGMLVSAVEKFAETQTKSKDGPQFFVAAELWTMLTLCSADERSFTYRYRNAVTLSKKLSSMQDSLKRRVSIEQQYNEAGVRQWKLASKNGQL